MPKKKPITKRLNKLFDEIQQEDPNSKPKVRAPKNAPVEKAAPPAGAKPVSKPRRAVEAAKTVTRTDTALALDFQTGLDTWATLQVLDETDERKWTEEDQLLVRQVTDQLSLALENARLFQETQSRAEDLSILNEMGNELSTKLDPKAIAEAVYKYTSRLMDTKTFYVALFDENKSEKSYPIAYENGERIELGIGKVEGFGFTDYIIRNKRAVFAPSNVDEVSERLGIEFVSLSEKDDTPSLSWLGVPMLIGNRVLGVIAVQSIDTPNLYDEQDRDILTAIASQAAIAVENARLFQESQRRAQEMSALAEVGREVSATLDLKTVLERIAEYGIILLNSVSSAVYIPDPEFKTLIPFAVVGDEAEEIMNDHLQVGTGILGNIALSKTGEIVNNAYQDSRAITIKGTTDDVQDEHLMAAPIKVKDRMTGLMAIWRMGKGTEFNETEFNFLTNLAQQAAIAIENARLFEDTQRRAEEMVTLNEIISAAGQTLELGNILEAVMQKILKTTGFDGGLVTIFNETRGKLERAVRIGMPGQSPADPAEGLEGSLCDFVYRGRRELIINDLSQGAPVDVSGEVKSGLHGYLGLPLESKGRVLGTLCLFRYANEVIQEGTISLTRTISGQLGFAIENARLFQEVTSSQGQLSEALRIARIGYFEIDWVANTITFTDELFSLLNTSVEKEDGYTFPLLDALQKFVVPEDIPIATQAVQDTIASDSNRSEVTSEVRYKTTDGRIIWVSSTYKVERDSHGNPTRIAGSSQDITERKTNELTQAAITQISESALTARTAKELFDTVYHSIQTILPAKNFYTALLDRTTNLLSFPYHADEIDDDWTPRRLGRGLTAYVIRSGKRLRTSPEIFADMEAAGEIVSDGAPSVDWLGVPLRGEGAVMGVMAVQTYDASVRITENQAENFELISIQTAAALERLQARESLQRRNTYLAASAEIGRLVTSTLDINTIFTRTVNLVSDRLGFYFAAIYQVEEEGFHATMREGTGGAGENMKIQKHRVSVGSQTIVGKAAETGETVLANDVQTEPLYQPNPLLLDTQSEVAIPLKVGGKVLGVIDIQSTQAQAFSADDISVLQSLADQVAVAINNATLYDESQELIKNLKEVDQLKSQFLANMSHELRTPLNSIIGFSRVILKGIDGPVTDMQQQDLTAIYNSGQHLLGLINDILDLARIEAGKMELNFEEVRLAEMVHSVFSTAKGLVKEKPIKLLEEVPADMPTVRGDTMRIRQVFINLISNASKFTDEGSITIRTQTQESPNGKLEALIKVIDTGPGITPEGQEKLFKAFSQVDGSATRKSGGSGLGLSICANLVQLHGGRIGVTSEEGKGSTFWFTIPLYNQPQEEIPEGKKVVLAIDDDPQVIALYDRYLSAQGYHVMPLTEPARAKDRIKELKPFAVTLDIMMPNIDGWTVLTELKSDPATRDIPIIICSIVEQTDKGFNLGAADYLLKPIMEDDLVHSLDRLNKNGTIRRVLVIDDDPDDLRLIEKILTENSSYKAILAEGGREGWEILNTNPPDAVILDIFMPEMDGFTILEKIRDEPALREIPVLVVSGGGLTNEQQKQLADYGQRLIAKGSLKEDDLIASIENALKRISD